MKLIRIVVCLAMNLVLLGGGSVSSTASAGNRHAGIVQQPAPGQHETPSQSMQGKVVAISKTELTLEVQANSESDSIDFVIDEHTKTEGDIKPGSMATVDYQTTDGKKYATHIMPAEAKHP